MYPVINSTICFNNVHIWSFFRSLFEKTLLSKYDFYALYVLFKEKVYVKRFGQQPGEVISIVVTDNKIFGMESARGGFMNLICQRIHRKLKYNSKSQI